MSINKQFREQVKESEDDHINGQPMSFDLLYENSIAESHGNQLFNSGLNTQTKTYELPTFEIQIDQEEPSTGTSLDNQKNNEQKEIQQTIVDKPEFIHQIEIGPASENKAVAAIMTPLIAYFPQLIEPSNIIPWIIYRENKSIRVNGSIQCLQYFQNSTLENFVKFKMKLLRKDFSTLVLKFNNLRKKERVNVVLYAMEYLNIHCVFDQKYVHKSELFLEKIQQKVLYKYLEYHLVKKEYRFSFRHYQYILRTLLQQLKDYHDRGNEKYQELEIKLKEFQSEE